MNKQAYSRVIGCAIIALLLATLLFLSGCVGITNSFDDPVRNIIIKPKPAYGELWMFENPNPIPLPVQNDYREVSDWVAGESLNVTLDIDNNRMVAGKKGMYLINVSLSFTGSPNTLFHFTIFKNGVREIKMHPQRTTGAVNTEGAVSISGLLDMNVGDYIDMRTEQETGINKQVTIQHANFSMVKIG